VAAMTIKILFCLRPVARFVAVRSEAAICNTGIIYLLGREVKYWQNNDYISTKHESKFCNLPDF
jgi:hypothetical protein